MVVTPVIRELAEMTVFPNPASDIVTIEVTKVDDHAQMTLCDAAGTIIKTVAVTNKRTTFDISGRPAGMYIVRYNDKTQAGFLTLRKL